MFEENKFMLATAGVVTASIVAVFAFIFLALPNDSVSDEEKEQYLQREDTYIKGAQDAEVQIVVFEDFQCPACAAYQTEFNKIKDEFGDNIRFVFRHFPLTNIHRNALISSQAAEAAGAQGKFYEFHDILFETQAEWSNLEGEALMDKFKEYATQAEVQDIAKFEKEIREETYKDKVLRDMSDGEALGVAATPTVFVNGEKIGNPNYQRLSDEVKDILE